MTFQNECSTSGSNFEKVVRYVDSDTYCFANLDSSSTFRIAAIRRRFSNHWREHLFWRIPNDADRIAFNLFKIGADLDGYFWYKYKLVIFLGVCSVFHREHRSAAKRFYLTASESQNTHTHTMNMVNVHGFKAFP